MRGRDAQDGIVFCPQRGEGRFNLGKGSGDAGGDALARCGKHPAASLAHEQRFAKPVFKQLDLIGHPGLGHAQFLCRAGVVFVFCRCLEHTNGS